MPHTAPGTSRKYWSHDFNKPELKQANTNVRQKGSIESNLIQTTLKMPSLIS